jgi:hypothetical protein
VGAYCGITGPAYLYDYGSTVVYQDNRVYTDGSPGPSFEDYAQQAIDFVDVGRRADPGKDEEWQPLGVFGLIEGEEKVATHIFQLAINRAGVIRGNYYNALTDTTQPAFGSVDRRTQRAAWSAGEKKNIVFETGLYNFTLEQATVLVHYGKDRTRQMVLVRLEDDSGGGEPRSEAWPARLRWAALAWCSRRDRVNL